MKLNKGTLIADIGSTNARIALTCNGKEYLNPVIYKMKDFASIESIFSKYLYSLNKLGHVKRAIIGVAAPILEDEIKFINSSFTFKQSELKKNLFQEKLLVLNDLEIQSHGLSSTTEDEKVLIGRTKNIEKGPKILVIPGTGLGLAGIVEDTIVSTEAGHLNIPENLKSTGFLMRSFKKDFKRMPTFEDFLSGKGISYVYSQISSDKTKLLSSKEIFKGNDNIEKSEETREYFVFLLAIYLRYMALIWGAKGGVFIAGSIINSLTEEIKEASFRKTFEDSYTMKSFLTHVPIYQVKLLNLGLRGALKLFSLT